MKRYQTLNANEEKGMETPKSLFYLGAYFLGTNVIAQNLEPFIVQIVAIVSLCC